MFTKIKMLQFLLIKYFTASTCVLLSRVQPVLTKRNSKCLIYRCNSPIGIVGGDFLAPEVTELWFVQTFSITNFKAPMHLLLRICARGTDEVSSPYPRITAFTSCISASSLW